MAQSDAAARQIVRRQLDAHAIARHDADFVGNHLAGEPAENDLPAPVELDAKGAAAR
jgi:hypothetical protein